MSNGRLTPTDVSLDDFAAVVEQSTDLAAYPHADRVDSNVLVYDAERLRAATTTDAGRDDVGAELVRAFAEGPGVAVFEGAFPDLAVVDRVTAVFDEIIAEEAAAGGAAGDHFAAPGANSRVWNALEKLALRAPEAFVDYYANDVIALASAAWLGPGYQLTSQVNVVRPGGTAQEPHRDYHLGFLSDELVARYPTHVHALSPVLTLQGAVAHSDMPLESGPTLYLPFSHLYLPGYLAWRRDDVKAYFADHVVQLPLRKGDAAFFNPAVLHGAGSNVSSDIQRMANLLQVSSAFGRAMEQVDRARVVGAVYPALRSSDLDPDGAGGRGRGVRRGLPVPDQPRPRPAGGRADPGLAGRRRASGARGGLGARTARGRAGRLHRASTHLTLRCGRGRASLDEGGLDPLQHARRVRVVDAVDQELDRRRAELVHALADAGELDQVEPGDLRVVEAHHTDVVGDVQTLRLEDAHRPDRDEVVGCDHGGGAWRHRQDLPGALLARLVREGARDLACLEAQLPHRGAVARRPVPWPTGWRRR